MLHGLLGFCLPVLLHVPLARPHQVRPPELSAYGWGARLMRAHEEQRLLRFPEYWGRVIGLTKDTVTVRLGTRIPRTFAMTPALLSDATPVVQSPGMGHRFRDVRLGDLVQMDVAVARWAPEGFACYSLGIYRRPGGKIPPAEDTHLPERARMHHHYNALQFAEEQAAPHLARLAARVTRAAVK